MNLGDVLLLLGFLVAIAVGVALGLVAQRGFACRVANKFALDTLIPTAWDWKFSAAEEQWVLVTLKDGTRFGGFLGSKSFVSSDPGERDVYIEKVFSLEEEDHNWKDVGPKSVLITAGEIKTIEFWPRADRTLKA